MVMRGILQEIKDMKSDTINKKPPTITYRYVPPTFRKKSLEVASKHIRRVSSLGAMYRKRNTLGDSASVPGLPQPNGGVRRNAWTKVVRGGRGTNTDTTNTSKYVKRMSVNNTKINITPELLTELVKEGFTINNGILWLKDYFLNKSGMTEKTIMNKRKYVYNPFTYSTDEIIFTNIGKKKETLEGAITRSEPVGGIIECQYDVVGEIFDILSALGGNRPTKFVLLVLCRVERELKYCSSAMKSIAFAKSVSSSSTGKVTKKTKKGGSFPGGSSFSDYFY